MVDDPLDDFLQRLHLKLLEISSGCDRLRREMHSTADWTAAQRILDDAIASLDRESPFVMPGPTASGMRANATPAHANAADAQELRNRLQQEAVRCAQSALQAFYSAVVAIDEAYRSMLIAWSSRRYRDHTYPEK